VVEVNNSEKVTLLSFSFFRPFFYTAAKRRSVYLNRWQTQIFLAVTGL